jgi:glycosyltransferase involved in cell wall biosynthesis
MRVAIDARRLQDNPLHGVGRGIANLLPHLVSRVEVVLLLDRRRPAPEAPGCQLVALSGIGRLPEPAWLQVSVARWLHDNRVLFHGTYNAVPYALTTPSVVTIHDLSWEHHPEDFPSRTRQFAIRAQARSSVRRARVVLTVSDFSRESIIDTYGLEPTKVLVTPNSVDPIFSPHRAEEGRAFLSRLGINGPYVVALGGARRRGLRVAIDAWKLATDGRGPRPHMVVVGSEEPPWADGVVYVGRLDDRSWSGVLAGAEAFCFPTRYEGFGMPALEAAASGTPVICAPIGPLPEILGDAAEWCDSPTTQDIADGLSRVLSDAQRQGHLRDLGLQAAAEAPSWEDSAAVLMEGYRQATV